MSPDPSNPLLTVAYVVALIVGAPVLYAVWKVALFFAKAITKLDQIDKIALALEGLLRERAEESFSTGLSFTVIEQDINALQEHTGLTVRPYPDRRTSGVADRRRAS